MWRLYFCSQTRKAFFFIQKKNTITYPTVVSDTTAHQNPWGDPIVNDGEKYVSFALCS